MRDMDGYWQITDINGKSFYKQINDYEAKLVQKRRSYSKRIGF
jgi:hypothetical protein